MNNKRPRIGQELYATEFSSIHNTGDYVGKVLRTEDNICFYSWPDGNTDQFIWRFERENITNRNVVWK